MKTVRMTINPGDTIGRIDTNRVDATTEKALLKQQAEDEVELMLDAAKFTLNFLNELKCLWKPFVIGSKVSVVRRGLRKHCSKS